MTIYKFPLAITREQFVTLSDPYTPLAVQMQQGRAMFWAVVDPDPDRAVVYRVLMFGTGWGDISMDGLFYIGTVQDPQGYVWHYFLKPEIAEVER